MALETLESAAPYAHSALAPVALPVVSSVPPSTLEDATTGSVDASKARAVDESAMVPGAFQRTGAGLSWKMRDQRAFYGLTPKPPRPQHRPRVEPAPLAPLELRTHSLDEWRVRLVALWLAVLEQAIRDLTIDEHRDAALRWFVAGDHEHVGACGWLCDLLGWNDHDLAIAVAARYQRWLDGEPILPGGAHA